MITKIIRKKKKTVKIKEKGKTALGKFWGKIRTCK